MSFASSPDGVRCPAAEGARDRMPVASRAKALPNFFLLSTAPEISRPFDRPYDRRSSDRVDVDVRHEPCCKSRCRCEDESSCLPPGSERSPGPSALPSRAHARRPSHARLHRGRRPSPALGAARRDRLAQTPTHRPATLGCQAASDEVRPNRWSRSPWSPRLGRTSCASSNPRRFFAGIAPASRLSGGGGTEHARHRASLRRRPP